MKIWIVLLDLIHLEDGILHMDINRSSKEEDNHDLLMTLEVTRT